MAVRDRTTFKATKNARYTANTSGDISSADGADSLEDVADSALFRQDDAFKSFGATASGTDTYTATLDPAPSAYVTNDRYFILFTNANTGAVTLNLNTLGAKAIRKNGSTALAAGDIAAGQIYCLAYDGTNIQIVGKIDSSAGTQLLTVTVPVSSSEILNLFTTPKQLIAAPGAGKYIQVLHGYVFLDYGGTAYSNTSTEIRYATAHAIFTPLTTFLNNGFDTLYNLSAVQNNPAAFSQFENSAVQYSALTSNPTTGNGTISINLIYRTVTI
jgi:hypothetical protein